tara:strand:+ start:1308 stop:2405 length:1098 start_codon:yes stop_codon:yes gene_type:complete
MTDKLEQKKNSNITPLDLSKKKDLNLPDEFIDKTEVHEILSANIGRWIDQWFKFLIEWYRNAYNTFNDIDKYFILIYLIQKSFRHYADHFIIYTEEAFYSKAEFEIEKINLIEISQDLKIPKETVRRKINEMTRDNVISRKGKKIVITPKAFQYQRPRQSIKLMSGVLSTCSKYLSTQEWFGAPASSDNIEKFTRQNFTLVWRFYFRFAIPYLTRQRQFYGDLETALVAGIIYANQSSKVKEHIISQPLTTSPLNEGVGAARNYVTWMKTVVNYNGKITGVNASSISEITGIPRATVIRKLNHIEKKELTFKDKNQLYILGKKYKKYIKELEKMFVISQIDLSKFVTTFFDLYKKDELTVKKISE